ncbi:cytochrome c oxidase subunit II [Natrialba hulunbeirensis JCM 10989]|uniref:Cytochrome c oxidase subunit II n=1 Tax=Natrialba hulunbeirensis JCM 10989 TaxID=1227493 RepID=M0A0B8_9EURY|nr:cytochrome c oxidase subunit II [Natrialba hulunbeirensis]ELY91776.1 cytochrome c oxidase subunit II [Natrialba hulunbeirensis JCM 10989]
MNIHTYEKLWLIAAMVLIVGFIATITYGSVGLGITMVGDQQDTVEPTELDDERFSDPRVAQVGENEYEAYVTAQMFSFQPDPIEVPEDSEVTFYVTSRDVIHSFSLVGTNVNTMVIPGEVAEMTVEFDEPQDYGVVCNEYCGPNHHNMEGMVHVVPEDEFDLTELDAEAPDEVETGDDIDVTATVENRLLDPIETTVTLEIGNETVSEDVTIDGGETDETTFTVDSAQLGEGDHEWTVTVDEHTDSWTVTVVDELEDGDADDDADDESNENTDAGDDTDGGENGTEDETDTDETESDASGGDDE